MKKSSIAILFVLALAAAVQAEETVKIIVHPASRTTALDKQHLSDLFYKRVTHWDDGSPVVVVDQTDKSQARAIFSTKILGKSVTAVKAYWTQQIFSGRELAPVEKASDAEVVDYVRQHPGAIGYVGGAAPADGVAVLTVK